MPINDWDNGDLGQRAAYVLGGLVDYYRYSGDPAAIAASTTRGRRMFHTMSQFADEMLPAGPIIVPANAAMMSSANAATTHHAENRRR